MIRNPVVDDVAEIRDRLIEQHGGAKAYFEHLMQLDQERLKREAAAKARKKAAAKVAKSPTSIKNAPAKRTLSKRSAKRK